MNNEKKLVNLMIDRSNNLDIIRFFAAILVIFAHSYPLTGYSNGEPLGVFTNGQSTFGELAVAIFFFISGFLITQSYDRSENLNIFLKARILRIFPALLFVLLITAFILGPIFTKISLAEYFSNSLLYKYFVGITLFPNFSPTLPGIFENNPFAGFVNGSLWTLKYEFFFYLVVAFFGFFNLLNKKVVAIFFSSFLLIATIGIESGLIQNFFLLGSYFAAGMLIYLFREKIQFNSLVALISLLALLVTAKIGYFESALAVFGTYLTFHLGYNQKIRFSNFTKYGDFSYGLYIFAFPIQQIVTQQYGESITPLINTIISIPITLIFAYVSWHLVEKKSLKLKYMTFYKTKQLKKAV